MPPFFERGMRRRWSNLQYHYNIKHRKKGASWTEKRGRERAEPSVIDAIRHKMMIITNLGSCLKMVKKWLLWLHPLSTYVSYPVIFSILFLFYVEVKKAMLLSSTSLPLANKKVFKLVWNVFDFPIKTNSLQKMY